MSIIKSIITCGFLPSLHVQPFNSSKSGAVPFYSSSSFATSRNNGRLMTTYYKSTRRFLVRSVVGPGAPMPPEHPFNFLNWIVGVAFTVVLPFFSNKWTSLLRIKNEIDTTVNLAEEIVVAVEKVTERVEKTAEEILEDLPEGGRLRKAVDFVEHIAERANRDAHIVGDFIDKVQEVEEDVEECVESLAATTHKVQEVEEDVEECIESLAEKSTNKINKTLNGEDKQEPIQQGNISDLYSSNI